MDTQYEKDLTICAIGQIGIDLGRLVNTLKASSETDKRWVAIGTTDLQTGLMALERSVTKPSSF